MNRRRLEDAAELAAAILRDPNPLVPFDVEMLEAVRARFWREVYVAVAGNFYGDPDQAMRFADRALDDYCARFEPKLEAHSKS
jgi:hypothetical protein